MSFQAYIDNIKTKTGKGPEDFKRLAEQKGLLKAGYKAGDIVNWLKADFGLGHGHAMAIYATFKGAKEQKGSVGDKVGKHFTGAKEVWKESFDALMKKVNDFGKDINLEAAASYVSILRGTKKIGIAQIGTKHMDIGIKLKGTLPTDRFAMAGNWNSMMTHRVRVTDKKEIDRELMDWLHEAYNNAV